MTPMTPRGSCLKMVLFWGMIITTVVVLVYGFLLNDSRDDSPETGTSAGTAPVETSSGSDTDSTGTQVSRNIGIGLLVLCVAYFLFESFLDRRRKLEFRRIWQGQAESVLQKAEARYRLRKRSTYNNILRAYAHNQLGHFAEAEGAACEALNAMEHRAYAKPGTSREWQYVGATLALHFALNHQGCHLEAAQVLLDCVADTEADPSHTMVVLAALSCYLAGKESEARDLLGDLEPFTAPATSRMPLIVVPGGPKNRSDLQASLIRLYAAYLRYKLYGEDQREAFVRYVNAIEEPAPDDPTADSPYVQKTLAIKREIEALLAEDGR